MKGIDLIVGAKGVGPGVSNAYFVNTGVPKES